MKCSRMRHKESYFLLHIKLLNSWSINLNHAMISSPLSLVILICYFQLIDLDSKSIRIRDHFYLSILCHCHIGKLACLIGHWCLRIQREHLMLQESVRFLVLWVLPCFILKTAREVIRILYVHHESWWQSALILVAFVFSSTYVAVIFLSSCILFHLVCNLQIIHFDDYGKLLERQSDTLVLMKEHVRLRHYLSKISHRFRIYIILIFLIVSISQFVTLFQTTGYRGIITFINGGDFAVSSIIQLVGIILCLNAAAKISHRAQAIGSLASQWHALLTCSSSETSLMRTSSSAGSLEVANISGSLHINYSESDLESLDLNATPSNARSASYISSYHKRQALVTYLQANPGGITIYGYTVDRVLINTIFVVELTLVLFVLGKTIVFTSG